MLISSRGRYGLRIMIELALAGAGETYIPLRDLARRQELSEKYLESILRDLVQAGYVVGRRGKGGGYRLAQAADTIDVYAVLTATEQNLHPVTCLEGEILCERRGECRTFPLWEALDRHIRVFLQKITLKDLV